MVKAEAAKKKAEAEVGILQQKMELQKQKGEQDAQQDQQRFMQEMRQDQQRFMQEMQQLFAKTSAVVQTTQQKMAVQSQQHEMQELQNPSPGSDAPVNPLGGEE
jgi:AAA15 family ATPase/GTPase